MEVLDNLLTRYCALSRDENRIGPILSENLRETLRRALDRITFSQFTGLLTRLLAVSYIATFDHDIDSRNVWVSIFEDLLVQSGYGNKLTALAKCYGVVFKYSYSYLDDLSWFRRSQGLLVLIDLISTLPIPSIYSTNTMPLYKSELGFTVHKLLQLLPGQMWSGKWHVLSLLALVANKCPDHFSQQSAKLDLGELDMEFSDSEEIVMWIDNNVDVIETEERSTDASESGLTDGIVILRVDDFYKKHSVADLNVSSQDNHMEDSVMYKSDTAVDSQTEYSDSKPYSKSAGNLDGFIEKSRFGCFKVSIKLLIQMFFRECIKSSKSTGSLFAEYFLNVSRALSTLPWGLISQQNITLTINILPLLYTLAALPAIHILEPMTSSLSNVIATVRDRLYTHDSSAFKDSCSTDSDSKPLSRLPEISLISDSISSKEVKVINKRTLVAQKNSKQVAMFGNRYGISSSAHSKLSVSNSVLNGNKRRIVSSSSQVSEVALAASKSNVIVDGNYVSSSSPQQAVLSANVRIVEPEYRLNFIECIISVWPSYVAVADNFKMSEILKGVTCITLEWILCLPRSEHWSIRVQAFKLLSKIVSDNLLLKALADKSVLIELMKLILQSFTQELSLEKKQYSVRVAVLEALESIIKSFCSNDNDVFASLRQEISAVIVLGCNDVQPAVIEIASQLSTYINTAFTKNG